MKLSISSIFTLLPHEHLFFCNIIYLLCPYSLFCLTCFWCVLIIFSSLKFEFSGLKFKFWFEALQYFVQHFLWSSYLVIVLFIFMFFSHFRFFFSMSAYFHLKVTVFSQVLLIMWILNVLLFKMFVINISRHNSRIWRMTPKCQKYQWLSIKIYPNEA